MNLITDDDIAFAKRILPSHYNVEINKKGNGIRCNSRKGIDENDEETWEYIFKAIQQRFGKNFSEVYHDTCADHLDFTILLKIKK